MAKVDTLDKIVGTYFASVAAEPFSYRGKNYQPKPLHVSPAFFHEFTCHLNCAGCCSRFTLDYLPSEPYPEGVKLEPRYAVFNMHEVFLLSYHQEYRGGVERFCDFVESPSGKCGIHGHHPFSCDFETLRFTQHSEHNWLGVRPYGRGWNMLRIDGERGAICSFPKISTEEALTDSIRKLRRLEEWTDHFGLKRTYIPTIIAWALQGPHKEPLQVSVYDNQTVARRFL